MTKIFLSCTISVGLAPLANYIYIYDEDFSQLYDKCGARAARQLYILENATALGLAYPAARSYNT